MLLLIDCFIMLFISLDIRIGVTNSLSRSCVLSVQRLASAFFFQLTFSSDIISITDAKTERRKYD